MTNTQTTGSDGLLKSEFHMIFVSSIVKTGLNARHKAEVCHPK